MSIPSVRLLVGRMSLALFVSVPAMAATTVFGPQSYTLATGSPQSVTATFGPGSDSGCGGTPQFFLVVANPDGGVRSATVSVNGTALLRERDFPLRAAREIPFAASTSNTLAIALKGGRPGSALIVSVERRGEETACGPGIAIHSPAAGAAIRSRRIAVSGTATGSGIAGISVNGVAADYDPSAAGTPSDPLRWFATIDAEDGAVTLSAAAVTKSGATAGDQRQVSFAREAGAVFLRPGPASGVAPFTTHFDLSLGIPDAIASYQFDLDGDGVFEQSSAARPDQLPMTYATPGMRTATARVTTADGRVFTGSTAVVALPFASMDATLRAVWAELREALAGGDVAAAVAQLSDDERRAKYRPALEALGTGLPAYADAIADIRPVWIHGNAAHYLMLKPEEGQVFGYHVYFVRGADGRWRVQQF